MDVVVRKSSSEVVRPPEMVTTSTTDHINLSPYDKGVMCQAVTVFLVFDHSIHQPAEAIKRALSKALLHYLPVSGRLAAGPGQHDELRITLTGEGVPFVAAAADCALKDVMFFDQSPLVEQLAIYYPAELCGLGDPLLMMQVTEFSCGGFVVGATWNHAVADAAGMGQFLQAVGELARGLASPSVVPVRWDDGLLPGPPRPNDGFMHLMMSLQPMDVAVVDITVPSKVINGIKEEYRVHSHGVMCTTFEAVTALLWQCRTRAIGLANLEDPVGMAFVVNARKYVPARDGYYGNCITAKLVMATAGAVANGRLVDVVEMIQRAKRQIAGQFHKEGGGADVEAQHVGSMVGYNLFVVTSWRNLGLEEVDFGGGRPVRVTSYAPERVRLMACVERQGIDGSANVRSGFITKEHAGTFLAEVSSRLKL